MVMEPLNVVLYSIKQFLRNTFEYAIYDRRALLRTMHRSYANEITTVISIEKMGKERKFDM